MPNKEWLPYLISIGILIYGFGGGTAFNLCVKRIGRNRPVSLHTDPDGWLRYVRPRATFMGLYGLVGIVALSLVIASTTPILRGPDAYFWELAWVVGVIFIGVFFIGAYLVMVMQARQVARRQRTATDGHDHT